jgi:phosphoribosylformylglycinamidine cyclo-ligase
MFEVPVLFELIQNQSNTSWHEMYKVFNCGHRMELYVNSDIANSIITISKSFNIDAKIIGRVEKSSEKKLTISSKYGEFIYK